jgi:hypothetical protein
LKGDAGRGSMLAFPASLAVTPIAVPAAGKRAP